MQYKANNDIALGETRIRFDVNGQWLVENMPRGTDIELPSRDEPERESPFISANRTVPTGLSHTRAHSP